MHYENGLIINLDVGINFLLLQPLKREIVHRKTIRAVEEKKRKKYFVILKKALPLQAAEVVKKLFEKLF